MIDRDDLPETPDWQCEPRACAVCGICETRSQSAFMHNVGEHLVESEPAWVRIIDEQGTN